MNPAIASQPNLATSKGSDASYASRLRGAGFETRALCPLEDPKLIFRSAETKQTFVEETIAREESASSFQHILFTACATF